MAGTGTGRPGVGLKLLAGLIVAALVVGGIAGGIVAAALDDDDGLAPGNGAPPAFPDIPTMIEDLRQSVVTIDVVRRISEGPRTITEEGAGTGIVLTEDGLIATNAHVVADATTITVTFSDGESVRAALLGMDEGEDLAVLEADRDGLSPITFGDSSDLRVGDLVVAVGNALALEGGPTATMGIVSALKRSVYTSGGNILEGLIQTDAAINEGDSGGPLVDRNGELVGINSAGTLTAENIGFAIAIDTALPILEALADRSLR
jgi:putative serine protease PepD